MQTSAFIVQFEMLSDQSVVYNVNWVDQYGAIVSIARPASESEAFDLCDKLNSDLASYR